VKRIIIGVVAAGCLAVGAAAGSALASPASAPAQEAAIAPGSWGAISAVPGAVALSARRFTTLQELSCPSAGNCTAIGDYTDSAGSQRTWAASETRGRWHRAHPVALPVYVTLLSCGSPGNCAATIADSPYVVTEVNGTWGKPHALPGIARVEAVSCAPGGYCAALGALRQPATTAGIMYTRAFASVYSHGSWSAPVRIALPRSAVHGPQTDLVSDVSCPAPRHCTAVGIFTTPKGKYSYSASMFIASQAGGRWQVRPAARAPGYWGAADPPVISCASPGNCAMGGDFATGPIPTGNDGLASEYPLTPPTTVVPFVATESRGRWQPPIMVPGLPASPWGQVLSVSCPATGACVAGGSTGPDGFVTGQARGTWHRARVFSDASFGTVSCASPGTCWTAGQGGLPASGVNGVFVVPLAGDHWGARRELRLGRRISPAPRGIDSIIVSCGRSGCTAGGTYDLGSYGLKGQEPWIAHWKPSALRGGRDWRHHR
jgi:hypothetical protein